MRVAYVCTDPGVPVFGWKGASIHVQSVLGVLLAQGADVHLVTPRTGGAVPEQLRGVHVHELPPPSAPSAAEREVACRRTDAEVAEVLDGVHDERPLDLLYERYSLWGRTATAWARRRGVPAVLEVNAPLVDEQAAHRVLVDRAGAEEVARAALSAAGAVVCVSEGVSAWARSQSQHPHRVRTVANGVDTRRVRPAVAATPSGGRFTIGFVGTLKPWHGVEDLVEAFGQLVAEDTSYRLLLVGDGPQRETLEAQARRLGVLDRVEMTGAVPPSQIPALLHRMQVAVAPYPMLPDFYFSPLKIYEYLAAGLPVVATSVGDVPAALEHGALGVLVAPGTPRELADAIAGLRADPARRLRLGRAARAAAVERHDWTTVVGRILELAERAR